MGRAGRVVALCAVAVLAACGGGGPGLIDLLADASATPSGVSADADPSVVVQALADDPATAAGFLGAGTPEDLADRWAAVFDAADPATGAAVAAAVFDVLEGGSPGPALIGMGAGLARHGSADMTVAVLDAVAPALPDLAAPDELGLSDTTMSTFAMDVVGGLDDEAVVAVLRSVTDVVVERVPGWVEDVLAPTDAILRDGAAVIVPFGQAVVASADSRTARELLADAVAPTDRGDDEDDGDDEPPSDLSLEVGIYVDLGTAAMVAIAADPDAAEVLRDVGVFLPGEVTDPSERNSDYPVEVGDGRIVVVEEDYFEAVASAFRQVIVRAVSG